MTEMTTIEAGAIVKAILRNDYFQSFHDYDRVHDPDKLYEIESTMTDSDENFLWSKAERRALSIFGTMTPNERAEALDYTLDAKGRPIVEVVSFVNPVRLATTRYAVDSNGNKVAEEDDDEEDVA